MVPFCLCDFVLFMIRFPVCTGLLYALVQDLVSLDTAHSSGIGVSVCYLRVLYQLSKSKTLAMWATLTHATHAPHAKGRAIQPMPKSSLFLRCFGGVGIGLLGT